MQGFWQRMQNYLQCNLLNFLLTFSNSRAERALSKSFGYDMDGSWARRSTSAALIAGGDWALEYPFPLPPKIHVSYHLNLLTATKFLYNSRAYSASLV